MDGHSEQGTEVVAAGPLALDPISPPRPQHSGCVPGTGAGPHPALDGPGHSSLASSVHTQPLSSGPGASAVGMGCFRPHANQERVLGPPEKWNW